MTKQSGWHRKTSNRMAELPADWPQRRAAVIARDRVCVLCGQPGRDVDHIQRGNNHALDNLRYLCQSCHMQRTGRDGGTTKRKPKRKHREPREHPGLTKAATKKRRTSR